MINIICSSGVVFELNVGSLRFSLHDLSLCGPSVDNPCETLSLAHANNLLLTTALKSLVKYVIIFAVSIIDG